MSNRYFIAIAFLMGVGGGWFGKTWLDTNHLTLGLVVNNTIDKNQANPDARVKKNMESNLASSSVLAQSSHAKPDKQKAVRNNDPKPVGQGLDVNHRTSISVIETFDNLLKNRRYFNAMTLFQDQKQQSEQVAAQLKVRLLKELKFLTETRNNIDFSELVENYLTIYYDDIEVLLILADFNRANGSYHEAVNVFLLAHTYSYSSADQEKVGTRFKQFVMNTDNTYTEQKNWWSLINLYAQINTSGLMTSTYQYRQALAHLRSGDTVFATEQLDQLRDDSLVGELAIKALSSIGRENESPSTEYSLSWVGADSIALQKLGNQYAVNLENSRRNSVKLLIDTGASMTALSREAFKTLNSIGDAVEQDRRVFRTANGLVQATVYSVPELSLGPHRLGNTQIAVIDFEKNRGIDGLLGMNILGQFRFQIDQDNAQLILSKK